MQVCSDMYAVTCLHDKRLRKKKLCQMSNARRSTSSNTTTIQDVS